jgi:SAM-dependent methyltransferase
MSLEIIHGESTEVLPRFAGQAALVYMDSLFNTGRTFKVGPDVAFVDRFESGLHFYHYLEGLVRACFRALAPYGTLVLHCDPTFVHTARDACDNVFGPRHFVDQIVWHYRRWPTKGTRCNRLHDYLVCYAVDPSQARWTQLYQPLAESTLRQWGTRAQKAVVRDGVRRRSIATEEESRGAPIGDVWTDINAVTRGRERTGFETQKPEKLLERVIRMRSLPGDLVIDPTLGSGSTAVAAQRLDRRFVGIDRSEVAIRVARERLAQMKIGVAA